MKEKLTLDEKLGQLFVDMLWQDSDEEIVERVQCMIALTRSEQEYLELHQKIRNSSYSEMEKIFEERKKNRDKISEGIKNQKEERKKRGHKACHFQEKCMKKHVQR